MWSVRASFVQPPPTALFLPSATLPNSLLLPLPLSHMLPPRHVFQASASSPLPCRPPNFSPRPARSPLHTATIPCPSRRCCRDHLGIDLWARTGHYRQYRQPGHRRRLLNPLCYRPRRRYWEERGGTIRSSTTARYRLCRQTVPRLEGSVDRETLRWRSRTGKPRQRRAGRRWRWRRRRDREGRNLWGVE